MKNLMIVAALALGTMTAFAQEETAIDEAGTAVEGTATEATEATEAAGQAYDAAQGTATETMEESTGEATEMMDKSTEEATESMEESTEEATESMEESTEEVTEEATAQDGFSEVTVEEVPEAITAALEEAHPGATIDGASMNEDSQYKLAVTTEAGESAELYMDAEGNMIEM